MNCRHCGSTLSVVFSDLGIAPPSNSYVAEHDLHNEQQKIPLKVLVCEHCWLVQTEDFTKAEELFTPDYAYFSAFSESWLKHCQSYVTSVIQRFELTKKSLVVEVAANDGYLLQYVSQAGIPCLGIEPTQATADAARQRGIKIIEDFFGVELAQSIAKKHDRADLIIANNVLAHVPEINDFVAGFTELLKPTGVATFEFPHLCELVSNNQFDTIYHEHYSYLSLNAVSSIFRSNGLEIFDVEQIKTHGGSLRVYAQRSDSGIEKPNHRVSDLLQEELDLGVCTKEYYANFDRQTKKIRNEFLEFLHSAKNSGKSVAAYGAAAKGNTLANYCGIDQDLIKFVVDRNPHKQGLFMPGSKIPIVNESQLKEETPDFIVIFPWNLLDEIAQQLNYTKTWGAQLVVAIPHLRLI